MTEGRFTNELKSQQNKKVTALQRTITKHIKKIKTASVSLYFNIVIHNKYLACNFKQKSLNISVNLKVDVDKS